MLNVLGQILGPYLIAVGEGDRPLDDVFQLPYVSGKGIAHEDLKRLGLYARDFFPESQAIFLDEMIDKKRNVVAAFAQPGQGYRHDVQPVEKVLAEVTLRDFMFEVPVGGGDDPDVQIDRRECSRHAGFASPG